MNNERFLEFTQLGKTYDTPQGPAVIITDFTLHVRQGEFICIIGQSGCGKSTILSMVMGLNEPTMGGGDSGRTRDQRPRDRPRRGLPVTSAPALVHSAG